MIAQSRIASTSFQEESNKMSTIEQQDTGIPTGTFQADTVHSSVGFEVPYAVATFTGTVTEFEASRVEGEITLKGITKPVVLEGTIVGPAVDHFGATRVGLKLETTIDRTQFDMK